MPCRDDGRQPIPDAALCAVMAALVRLGLVKEVLAHIDWPNAGLTELELHDWWWKHKQLDKSRGLEW